MKATYQWALGVAAVSVMAMGCGGDDDEGAEKKQIERVEVADSDFKPTELEATIDDLVEALTETEADSFEMTVVTKPFGGYWEPVKVGANRAMAELELTGQVEAPTDEDDPDVTTEAQIEIVKNRARRVRRPGHRPCASPRRGDGRLLRRRSPRGHHRQRPAGVRSPPVHRH